MRKKKILTLENVAKKLTQEGAKSLKLSEETYLIFYTRIMFETIESNNNIFQPTTQKEKVFVPSYFLITTNNELQKDNPLCSTIFNIHKKTIFLEDFVNTEIIDFFNQNIF